MDTPSNISNGLTLGLLRLKVVGIGSVVVLGTNAEDSVVASLPTFKDSKSKLKGFCDL